MWGCDITGPSGKRARIAFVPTWWARRAHFDVTDKREWSENAVIKWVKVNPIFPLRIAFLHFASSLSLLYDQAPTKGHSRFL
jgi:hypothetical protein